MLDGSILNVVIRYIFTFIDQMVGWFCHERCDTRVLIYLGWLDGWMVGWLLLRILEALTGPSFI